MKNILVLVMLLSFGCNNRDLEATVKGNDGISMGLDLSVASDLSCPTGGTKLSTFVDSDRDGLLTASELIKQVKYVCNGSNGSNGTNGSDGASVTVSSLAVGSTQCATGGVLINTIAVCNGANGLNGSNGTNGMNGTNGINAASSVGNVTPVQLCPGDTGFHKEYGLFINNNLYAVYYAPAQGLGFLDQLPAGTYSTTNGSGCVFNYANNGSTATLSNGSGTTLLPLSSPINGLACQVYDSQSIDRSSGLNTILTNAVPKFEVIINQFDVPDTNASLGFPKFTAAQQALIGTEDYALDCSGYINVPKSQTYKLTMLSDDGSKLYINNNLLISMDQLQAPASSSISIYLLKGINKVNVIYFQGPLSQIALSLSWTAPEFSTTIIPSSVLTH